MFLMNKVIYAFQSFFIHWAYINKKHVGIHMINNRNLKNKIKRKATDKVSPSPFCFAFVSNFDTVGLQILSIYKKKN